MSSDSFVFIAVVIANLAVVIGIGIWGYLHTSTEEEFLVAGRRIGPWVGGCVLAATQISAGTFVGTLGRHYFTGVSWVWIWFGAWAGWMTSALFVAPKLCRFGALTVADYVGKRFASERGRTLAAALIIVSYTIEGGEDPDEFLLVHGHYDSWYEGIGDNATGNAALLELARVLHGLRARLKRSVRIAWWPGHSTGRYAGSTWYADTFADEIDERCIAHLNIDSPGCAGASASEEVMWMAEAGDLCTRAIEDAVSTPAQRIRPLRAGDYSFNQIGPTAFYMLLSNIPKEERARRGYYAVGGCGGNVAWHTPQDRLDVADLAVLRADLRVYLTTIIRTVNAPLYPFDYAAAVDEIAAAVTQYHAAAGGDVDLQPVLDDLRALRADYGRWRAAAEAQIASASASERRALNGTLRRLARHLVPLNYARGERFDHDPAIKYGPVPRLESATRLAAAPAGLKPFIRTGLLRERNKVRAMLRAARREL